MNITNLGQNVCGVSGFHYEYGDYKVKPDAYETMTAELEAIKQKFIFGFTANKFQKPSRAILKNLGYREVTTFASAHNVNDETLTLWTKTQTDCKETPEGVKGIFGGNCSVSFINANNENNYRCRIWVKQPAETEKSLRGKGFKRIKGTPIWFAIDKQHITPMEKRKALGLV